MDYLSEHAEERGVSFAELSRGTEMNKSTLLRLLAPLQDFALVEQDPLSDRYRVGVKSLQWAEACIAGLRLRHIAAPFLRELMEASHETVHLVVYDHGHVVYIDKVESSNTIRMFSRIGSRMPAYCTAVGKSFLAYLPESAFEDAVTQGLAQRTDNTLTTPEALRDDLERIRLRGYAVDDEENEAGVRCIGAPIFDHSARVAAALSVSGPTSRITPEQVEHLGRLVKGVSEQISEHLGFRLSRFTLNV